MKNLELHGIKIRVTKYKVTIFDDGKNKIGVEQAEVIAHYLKNEGFIEKDEIPIEIIRVE
tara:strand:- start:2344 stop:2523 length:180 start_codon:yes stop_codon:yes gene_type:complete